MPRRPTAALIGALVGLHAMVGCAQQDSSVAGGLEAAREGRYEEARAILRTHLDTPDTTGVVPIAYLESFRATGDYRGGLAEANRLLAGQTSANESAAFIHYMRGRLLAETGQYGDAQAALREAGRLRRNYWRNALALSELYHKTGQLRDAYRIDAALFSAYKQGYFRTSTDLSVAGRAAVFVGEFHDANTAFRTASQVDPRNTENLYWWGELFREKYNAADATATLDEAAAVNPNADWILVALAKASGGFEHKERLALRALEANANSVGALSLLSSIRLLDGDDAQAAALADRALAVNPHSLEALAQRASVEYVAGDTASFRQTEAEALAVNAAPVNFYVDVAENLALRFRYEDALDVSRMAVSSSPQNPSALAALGRSLLRLGRPDEAERYLDAAFERDEFNLYVGNALTLVEEYADFQTLASPHFELIIHGSEADVLGPLMLEEAEAAYADFSERYGYVPDGKIRVEAYNDADDFAVRIAGLPHLGLLGVAFGDIVALNTPRALPGQPYNWARTLRHELAHTMAMGASRHRVPRWFTEGLSVYEEKRIRPDWAREMEFELFDALNRDKLHPLADMDRGFTRPEFPGQVLLSYYHAAQVVEYLVNQYGFDAIRVTLAALAEGDDIESALERASGLDIAALDEQFTADLTARRRVASARLGGLPDVLAPDNTDGAVGQRPTGRSGENRLSSALLEAHRMMEDGRVDEAEARFREAVELYPAYVGPGNAWLALADIYRKRADDARLADALAGYLANADHGAGEARELAAIRAESGRMTDAIGLLERSLEVDPYDRAARDQLAGWLAEAGRTDEAVRERRAILALEPVDRAEAYFRLASALFDVDDVRRAKRATLQALEIAPGHREAQRLLLACVEREEAGGGAGK